MQMNILTLASLFLAASSHQAIADDDHVSITPGETFPTTQEEIAERSFIFDDENEFKENISTRLRRSTSTFGGSNYTRREEKKLLKVHNYLRRQVFPSASNMNELVWSSQLAAQAQAWSDGCYFGHPSVSEHPDYIGISQNLYHKDLDKGGKHPPIVTYPVHHWYKESKGYSYPLNHCRGFVCGHYKQVVWADTEKVGCGITFCKLLRDILGYRFENSWLVTCNYSPGGNFAGQRPYLAGEYCTACRNGFCRNRLCSKCRKGDRGCECRLVCQNCGLLNRKTCKCNCLAQFHGETCQKECRDTDSRCGANPGWPLFWCNNSQFSIVNERCPAMCGLCEVFNGGRPLC